MEEDYEESDRQFQPLRAVRAGGLGADAKSEAEAKRLEGRALIRAGQPEAASAAYRRSIELNPENAKAYVGLATVLDAQNHSLMERGNGVQTNLLQELIATSKRALELDPKQLEARGLLGNAYMDLGRFDEAIREHEAVLKLCPTNADAMLNLGAALEGAGQSAGALDLFHKAAVLRPNLMLVYRNIGFYHYKRHQWRQAMDAYLTARALDEFVSRW